MADKFTLQQVAQLVASSPNFTKDEAEEWLRLVPLMNDQQLREVTRILRAMAESNVTAGMKSARVGQTFSVPSGGMGQEFSPKVEQNLSLTNATPLIEPDLKTMNPQVGPAQDFYYHGRPLPEAVNQGGLLSSAVVGPEPVQPAMHVNKHAGVALHEIKSIENVAGISVESLRAWGEEGLFSALKPIVQEYSWALTRLEFEQSPLFRAYVDTGRQSLGGGQSENADLLDRHEFEAVADLLQRLAGVS